MLFLGLAGPFGGLVIGYGVTPAGCGDRSTN